MLFQVSSFRRRARKVGFLRVGMEGFTLIEVLAVTGLVLVLAAVLFPAGKSLIDQSTQSQCTANLRQLSLAVRQYAQDNNDRIIYSRGQRGTTKSMDWAPELAFNGYLGKDAVAAGSIGSLDQVGKIPVFRCPAAMANRRGNEEAASQYTYGFNAHLSDAGTDDGLESEKAKRTFFKLSRPSHTLMISEGSGTTGWYLNSAKLPNAEHNGHANVLFCDGHIEMRDPQKFPSRGTTEGKVFWDGTEG